VKQLGTDKRKGGQQQPGEGCCWERRTGDVTELLPHKEAVVGALEALVGGGQLHGAPKSAPGARLGAGVPQLHGEVARAVLLVHCLHAQPARLHTGTPHQGVGTGHREVSRIAQVSGASGFKSQLQKFFLERTGLAEKGQMRVDQGCAAGVLTSVRLLQARGPRVQLVEVEEGEGPGAGAPRWTSSCRPSSSVLQL